MSSMMQHNGYIGSVQYSDEDEVFHGKLEGIRDLVTYEGTDVVSLKEAFREAIQDYIQTCEKHQRTPDTPFKGSFNIRIGPDLHKRAAAFAIEHKKKLNAVVSAALESYLNTAH